MRRQVQGMRPLFIFTLFVLVKFWVGWRGTTNVLACTHLIKNNLTQILIPQFQLGEDHMDVTQFRAS